MEYKLIKNFIEDENSTFEDLAKELVSKYPTEVVNLIGNIIDELKYNSILRLKKCLKTKEILEANTMKLKIRLEL